MTTITMTLPDELAQKAKARGLLTSEALAELVRNAMKNEPATPMSASEALAALMSFGDGRRLEGLSLREIAREGCR